jgi:hypothetical protein
MSDRTIIAVVSDLRKSGLTVEQQILMDEFLMLAARAEARAQAAVELAEMDEERRLAEREYERERKRQYRLSRMSQNVPDVPGTKESPPHPQKKTKNINNNITPLTPLAEPLFDEFWRVYPLKVGKGAARKAFRHACTRASAGTIIDGVERYVVSKPDPKFTKHPATWLNADCWLDEQTNVVAYQRPAYLETQRSYRDQKREAE